MRSDPRPAARRRPPRTLAGIGLFAAVVLVLAGAAASQEPISEVTVIRGGSASIPPPAGYTKINMDLNAGAGGDYIYVCYKRGVAAPITGLYVTRNSGQPPADPAYSRIDVDLNGGAGGDFIWLWTSRDPDCAAVCDIIVQFGQNATPPPGYTKINVDLNATVGGQYIYLSYLKQ